MLVIDDNLFKLAKMQETLLRVSGPNNIENLNNYKKTVLEIDAKAFADILEEIGHINEHNHSLESEYQFLERIKSAYDRLLELQCNFRRVCETYGHMSIELSDLSRLNIDYIESRMSAINGYLLNQKNIKQNKERLEKLNEQLVEEEKVKISLEKKLSYLEESLRRNFLVAEGRCIIDNKLQYASICSEYESLGFDFRILLDDVVLLRHTIDELNKIKANKLESLEAAELCYKTTLSPESKLILDEFKKEYLFVEHKLRMLRVIELLQHDNTDYQSIVNKRKELLKLINERTTYVKGDLNMNLPIDPFTRVEISSQLDILSHISDNSLTIDNIRKEISSLNTRTEEMIAQNNQYLITLSQTKNLIEDRLRISDIDTSDVLLPFEDGLIKKKVNDNQVVSVKTVSSNFNMSKVKQQSGEVIRRVSRMVGKSSPVVTFKKTSSPELVIVRSNVQNNVDAVSPVISVPEEETKIEVKPIELSVPKVQLSVPSAEIKKVEPISETIVSSSVVPEEFSDMFAAVDPFVEPSLFNDRVDETKVDVFPNLIFDEPVFVDQKVDVVQTEENVASDSNIEPLPEVLPEAFWVTQSDSVDEDMSSVVTPSFDEQIDALLQIESGSANKVKKKAA